MSRFARQRDANEPEIVRAFVARGATVTKLNAPGCPDLLVGYRGVTLLVEVKRDERTTRGTRTDERGLLVTQQRWWAVWMGRAPAICRSESDVRVILGDIDAELDGAVDYTR